MSQLRRVIAISGHLPYKLVKKQDSNGMAAITVHSTRSEDFTRKPRQGTSIVPIKARPTGGTREEEPFYYERNSSLALFFLNPSLNDK